MGDGDVRLGHRPQGLAFAARLPPRLPPTLLPAALRLPGEAVAGGGLAGVLAVAGQLLFEPLEAGGQLGDDYLLLGDDRQQALDQGNDRLGAGIINRLDLGTGHGKNRRPGSRSAPRAGSHCRTYSGFRHRSARFLLALSRSLGQGRIVTRTVTSTSRITATT